MMKVRLMTDNKISKVIIIVFIRELPPLELVEESWSTLVSCFTLAEALASPAFPRKGAAMMAAMKSRIRKFRRINSVTDIEAEGDEAGATVAEGAFHFIVPWLEWGGLLNGALADELGD